MVKKTTPDNSQDNLSLFEIMQKKHGDCAVVMGNNIPPIYRFSTGIAGLDVVTGGGWPKGRLVELAGKESMGKSAIMLMSCKHEVNQGYQAVYQDLEETLAKDHLINLESRNLQLFDGNNLGENLLVCKPVYGEDCVDVALTAANSGCRLIVTDSLPFMDPKAVVDKTQDDSNYNGPAMAQAAMFKRLKGKIVSGLTATDACWVLVNQVRDNIKSPHGGLDTPGGHTIKHLFSIEMMITQAIKENDKPGMIKSHLKVIKNKTFTPHLTTEIPIYKGVVQLGQSLVIEAVKVGLMQKAGSWMKFNEAYAGELGVEKINAGQGEEKAGEFLDSNPELYARIYKDVLTKNGIV
jgi:recombination protein RecA